MIYTDYADLQGIRSGDLTRLAKSQLHYREQAGTGDTPLRRLERAIHCLLLEPERYDEQFAVFRDQGGKGVQARRKSFLLCNEGRTVLTPDADSKARAIARGCRGRPAVRAALDPPGESEVTLQWTDPVFGFACKARPDRLLACNWLIDLKNYGTSDPREIARRVVSLGAHVQLAHYHAGLLADRGIDARVFVLSIETGPPYDAALVELEPDGALSQGYLDRHRLLVRLEQCYADNYWPGRCEQIVPIELPTYGRPEVGDGEDGLDVDLDDAQEMP